MKVFLTKYALSSGIIEMEVDECGDDAVRERGNMWHVFYGEGEEWHKTIESARGRAEEMRIKRLKSLDKQMKKISAMTF